MTQKLRHEMNPIPLYFYDGPNQVSNVNPVTAPHDCMMPGCPGPVNKRKLEAFEELLDALWALVDMYKKCESTNYPPTETFPGEKDSDGGKCAWCQARAAIARASPQAQ